MMRREGKVLQGQIKQLKNIQFSSWVDDVLPEVLWSTLIVSTFPQDVALEMFRGVIKQVEAHRDTLGSRRLDHSQLCELDQKSFNLIFEKLCADKSAGSALSPLLLLDGLPDKERWAALLPTPVPQEAWDRLANAVATTFDHQSQEATDCRWLRVRTEIAKDKMRFAPHMNEQRLEICEYPNHGDIRKVRPTVRAAEMGLRAGMLKGDTVSEWPSKFWAETWTKTQCWPIDPDDGAKTNDHSELFKRLLELDQKIFEHFINTVESTATDPRHDGAFGLVFYIMALFTLALKSTVGQTIQGRLNLRSAVEALVNLTFLAFKDDPTIWLQYRNYGTGQAKLSYLKFKDDDAPAFMTSELLEGIANADMWMEHQDIKLGAWSDKNLRVMAEEAGIKSLYDKYYDALSGYTHANWAAVRHSAFGVCLNPLHRFHRIPLPARLFLDDAVPDLAKIVNLALDQLTKLYPPFKPRLKHDAA